MIAFSFYDKVSKVLDVTDDRACYVKEAEKDDQLVEMLPPERDIADDRPCNDPIPIYLPGSRFHPAAARRFVFALDWETLCAREGARFTHCLQTLDVVGGARTRTSLVTLDAMQVFFAMEGIEAAAAGDIDFLNVRLGPAGVQLPNSERREALVVVVGATYVHLPHATTHVLTDDGRVDARRTRQLVNGDRLYLVFREVRHRMHYARARTSRGPVAFAVRVGAVYPDIIACNRALAGHRQIGIVETVEDVSDLDGVAYVRARLTLSTREDAALLREV